MAWGDEMDSSFTTYPWNWHNKSVGRWIIEVPLDPARYGVFGHGCLLDIVADVLDAIGDVFFPTQIECPVKHTLFDRPLPLPREVVREALDRQWSFLAQAEDYTPSCDIYGVSHIYVRNATGVTRAPVPHVIDLRLDCDLGRRPIARVSVNTKCDAWLQRTVDGYDNAIVGSANGPVLSDKLIALEAQLGGEIAEMSTDFDCVKIERYGLKNV